MTEREIPAIIGIGKAVGRKRISNKDVAEKVALQRNGENGDQSRFRRLVKVVERMLAPVGTDNRFWVDNDQATSDLASEAILKALELTDYTAKGLKAITVATMSGDYLGVPVAPSVQNKIGAREHISAKDIGAACAGFLHVLYDAYKDLTSPLGQGGPQAVVGSDVPSRHIHPSHGETYGLFGDAAGAVVVDLIADRNNLFSKIKFDFGVDGKHQRDLYIPAGGTVNPTTLETASDSNNQHCLQMNGALVKEHAVRRMVESVKNVMQTADIKVGDISLFIPHQANSQIILEVAKALGIPERLLYKNIERYGNTSAASIPLAMKDAYDEGKLLPDEIIVLASFGAGFTYGAAVIPTVGLPKRKPSEVIKHAVLAPFQR